MVRKAVASGALGGKSRRWRIPRKSFIEDLCQLAILEAKAPHLCHTCDGRGTVILWSEETQAFKREDCKVCAGSCHGPSPFRDADRAEFLRVSPDAYCHSWRDRYEAILALVDKYDAIAQGALKKILERA